MPVRAEDLGGKPTIFDQLKEKSLPEVIRLVIEIAFKGLTGKAVTIFQWTGQAGKKDAPDRPTKVKK